MFLRAQAVAPRSPFDGSELYTHYRIGDRNVDFGDDYTPSLMAPPPEFFFAPPCVGPEYVIPQFLSLDGETENPLWDPLDPSRSVELVLEKVLVQPIEKLFGEGSVPVWPAGKSELREQRLAQMRATGQAPVEEARRKSRRFMA